MAQKHTFVKKLFQNNTNRQSWEMYLLKFQSMTHIYIHVDQFN